MQIKIALTKSELSDVLCDAGAACFYWAQTDVPIAALLDGESVAFTDRETGEDLGVLTPLMLKNAANNLAMLCAKGDIGKHHIANLLTGNVDRSLADLFVQVALLNKIVYG